MKALQGTITLDIPATCYFCPFRYYDSDMGENCCTYGGTLEHKGHEIKSPEDALQYGFDCAFIR
jgi:hypothetical protein